MADVRTKNRSGLGLDLLSARNLSSRVLLSVAQRLKVGRLHLQLPDGDLHSVEGAIEGPHGTLVVHRPHAVHRLLTGGANGFAESYMDGDCDSPDLTAFLSLVNANEQALGSNVTGLGLARQMDRVRHILRKNTRSGSRRNIAYHYDLGNPFFAAWLDPSMTYSSALFDRPRQTLEEAQINKYRRLARVLDLRHGHRVLEIGCGWGGFAIMAARDYGCAVTAITLSREQHDYARQRVSEAGLTDRIDVRLQDYRDVRGSFDRIASVEMFEAVGEEYWSIFFDTIRERLTAEGLAALQIITIADDRFAQYRQAADFIQTYIFPGGMLPSPSVLRQQLAQAGLIATDELAFGDSYAQTLALWRRAFDKAWLGIAPLGFDERFRRMWTFYLSYCEAGFRSGAIDVAQYEIRRC